MKTIDLSALQPIAKASCVSCRFSHRSNGDLLCRRNPPQLSVVLGPAPPPQVGLMPIPFCGFPPVNERMWCGEWRSPMEKTPIVMRAEMVTEQDNAA